MICPSCHIGYMTQHPELMFYRKCQFCGFCNVNKDLKDRYPLADTQTRVNHAEMVQEKRADKEPTDN